jgi:glycosyltransferase involved in cell wall biosynthesis/LmbE family N-acetylglucosaminyl deacetylase
MRILLTADPAIAVPPQGYGGIERIVDALVRHYRTQNHTIGLVAHRDSRSPANEHFPWPGRSSTSLRDTLRNTLALRRAVRVFRPDVLHSFSRLAYLSPLLLTRLPKVMSYQRHTGGPQIALATCLGGRSLRFTGCSEYICRLGRAAGGLWSAIPNFVDPDRYTFVGRVAPDAPLVFLSRFETIKGPDLAIAIAKASGRRLILAGNHADRGPEFVFWRDRIAPHIGHDGIEWVGEVNDRQKNDLLGRAAALLVPIQWGEPFGIVFAEALACGTPVISCRRGALPEIVEEGLTGLFVDSIADGVAAVARIPALDRAACRAAVESRFSTPTCAAAYLRLYSDIGAGPVSFNRISRAGSPSVRRPSNSIVGALCSWVVPLSLWMTQIPWVKRILRRLVNRSVSVLLRLRSRNYTPSDNGVTLIIAPHQDDGTLGCGGLMLRKRLEGHPLHIVYVTDGSASHLGHPTMTPQAMAAVREREGRASARHLGIETPAIHFLGARDGTLPHLSPENKAALVEDFRRLLVAIRPDEIFLPYRCDGSSEHEAAFRLFIETLAGIELQPRIYEYLVWSWWNPLRLLRAWLTARRVWRFSFRGYEDIKIAALKCYVSQFEPTPPWDKPMLSPEFVRLFQRPCEFYLEI